MLVQITGAHMLCPLNLALIRLQLAGDDVHEGGFTLAVCAHQANVLTL